MSEDILLRLARLEHRVANINPVGAVAERDHEKGVRVRLGGTDDNPFLSPWIQPGDWSGVSRYVPDIGEQVMINAPGGDWSQATLHPLTHSDAKKNPASDIDETVHFNRNGVRHSTKKGSTVTKTDKVTKTQTADQHTVETGKVAVTADQDQHSIKHSGGSEHKVGKDSIVSDTPTHKVRTKLLVASGL